MVDLFAGDVINNRCERLRLAKLEPACASLEPEKFSALLPLVKSMGYTLSTAAQHAMVARTWPRGDRVGGLAYGHYKAVQGCDGTNGKLTREQARQILQDAQMGYTDKAGNFIQPHPPSWVKRQRQALEGNAKAKIEQATKAETNEVINEVVPEVERAIKSTGVTSRKAASLTKKVESAIKKTTEKLEQEFSSAVDAEVEKQTAKNREAMSEYAQERKRYESLRDGLSMPITEAEFKILRQFRHPDKHAGNEAKAGQAYEIVMAIGERLQFNRKAS